jgi:hypothetical protein
LHVTTQQYRTFAPQPWGLQPCRAQPVACSLAACNRTACSLQPCSLAACSLATRSLQPCPGRRHWPEASKFIRFGAMDVTKPYKFIVFGAMDVTKPYEFLGLARYLKAGWPDFWGAFWRSGPGGPGKPSKMWGCEAPIFLKALPSRDRPNLKNTPPKTKSARLPSGTQ